MGRIQEWIWRFEWELFAWPRENPHTSVARESSNTTCRYKQITHLNSSLHTEYSKFEVLSESEGYQLKIGGFSGNAGDSLTYHNDQNFSTKDRDQDETDLLHCAQLDTGGWWFRGCQFVNLNGLYPTQGQLDEKYMSWFYFASSQGGIMFSEMKFKYSLS